MCWDKTSLSERSFFEQTQLLNEAPMKGFVPQIDVTVAVDLLIERAAETKMIASQVLHMLLTGRVGDKNSWVPVRNRMAKIQREIAKYSDQGTVQVLAAKCRAATRVCLLPHPTLTSGPITSKPRRKPAAVKVRPK